MQQSTPQRTDALPILAQGVAYRAPDIDREILAPFVPRSPSIDPPFRRRGEGFCWHVEKCNRKARGKVKGKRDR